MKALLLAAGLGTRLRPLTDAIPKCLVPINGKPLLEYWLEMLSEAGVSPIVVNIHHHADQVLRHIERSKYRDNVITSFEPELLGTGGTLLNNRHILEDETFMVVHADNFSIFDVQHFIEHHHRRPPYCALTMMTFETDTPQSCGIIELDELGVVVSFREKPKSSDNRLANAAVYIMEPEVINLLAQLGSQHIDLSSQVLPYYIGRISSFRNTFYHRDIGTPESYALASNEFPHRIMP